MISVFLYMWLSVHDENIMPPFAEAKRGVMAIARPYCKLSPTELFPVGGTAACVLSRIDCPTATTGGQSMAAT